MRWACSQKAAPGTYLLLTSAAGPVAVDPLLQPLCAREAGSRCDNGLYTLRPWFFLTLIDLRVGFIYLFIFFIFCLVLSKGVGMMHSKLFA